MWERPGTEVVWRQERKPVKANWSTQAKLKANASHTFDDFFMAQAGGKSLFLPLASAFCTLPFTRAGLQQHNLNLPKSTILSMKVTRPNWQPLSKVPQFLSCVWAKVCRKSSGVHSDRFCSLAGNYLKTHILDKSHREQSLKKRSKAAAPQLQHTAYAFPGSSCTTSFETATLQSQLPTTENIAKK